MEFDPISRIVRLALAEDVGPGDVTTQLTVDPEVRAEARLIAKQDMVVSGLEAARMTFGLVDSALDFQALAGDGDRLENGARIALIKGKAASILTAERVALNLIMRLSGVATLTARFMEAVSGTSARIVDTRKTTPGLRALEKAAVRHGGGHNHRFALFDGILIKDNHISAAGSITRAIQKAKAGAPHTMKIEIEVENIKGLEEAIAAGADIVLLDNMNVESLTEAVKRAQGRVLLEASGGVNLETAARIAATGVDLISVGALTHSAPAVDISLRFD